jgi:pyruvate-formate lyase
MPDMYAEVAWKLDKGIGYVFKKSKSNTHFTRYVCRKWHLEIDWQADVYAKTENRIHILPDMYAENAKRMPFVFGE